jgi:hypothetical protein
VPLKYTSPGSHVNFYNWAGGNHFGRNAGSSMVNVYVHFRARFRSICHRTQAPTPSFEMIHFSLDWLLRRFTKLVLASQANTLITLRLPRAVHPSKVLPLAHIYNFTFLIKIAHLSHTARYYWEAPISADDLAQGPEREHMSRTYAAIATVRHVVPRSLCKHTFRSAAAIASCTAELVHCCWSGCTFVGAVALLSKLLHFCWSCCTFVGAVALLLELLHCCRSCCTVVGAVTFVGAGALLSELLHFCLSCCTWMRAVARTSD